MRVKLTSPSQMALALRHRLLLEEDEVNPTDGELQIDDRFFGHQLPDLVVRGLGIEMVSKPQTHFFVKWMDHDWVPQTMVGVTVRGLMNGDLSVQTDSAVGIKFIDQQPSLCESEMVTEFFKSWVGPITIGYAGDEVESIHYGLPGLLVPPVLEQISVRISDYIRSPASHTIREKWTVGVLLSSWPWPGKETAKEIITVKGVGGGLRKHLWPFCEKVYKESFTTRELKIGMVTGWDIEGLGATCRRVLGTCRNLDIPMKQHRTDLEQAIGKGWEVARQYIS